MQVESLRIFRDLVDSQSFSKAAQMNGITQSAVSQQVRSMEDRFRIPLIERTSKRFGLTQGGELLYETSKEMMSQFDLLQQQLDEMQSIISGSIRVTTVYSVGLHELPRYLKQFLKEFPKVNIHVEYRRSNEVYDEVLNGMSDLGLVAFPTPKKGIRIEHFKNDHLVVICSPQHPLAQKEHVEIEDLVPHKFIGFELDIPTRHAIDSIFHERDKQVKPVMEFDNIETVKRAVEIDAGISIVPRATVEQEAQAGSLKVLEFKDQVHQRPLGIIYKANRILSSSMKRFLATLQERPCTKMHSKTEE